MRYYKKKTVCLSVEKNGNIFILCIVIYALKWAKGILGNFTCRSISLYVNGLKVQTETLCSIHNKSIKISNKELLKFVHYALTSVRIDKRGCSFLT